MTEHRAGASFRSMTDQAKPTQPYPLLRRFIGVGGPVFALFLIALAASSIFAVRQTVEDIYLKLAEQRASGVAKGVHDSHYREWTHLIDRESLSPGDYEVLTKAIEKEAGEFRLNRLKVYDVGGVTLFSQNPEDIGKIETGDALRKVLETQEPGLDRTTDPDGTVFYELYVPFFENGKMAAIFELYEPIGYLDGLLLGAVGPAAVVPVVLLSLLVAVLFQLARRAQKDIDWRTLRIADLTRRVEKLVSRRAVAAMHDAGESGTVPHMVDCTLFFSDIRGFTKFSERHSPEQVIESLNDIIALQVEALEEAGGDVDKFIGDAVFARFEGRDRQAQALKAAKTIQQRIREGGYSLKLGIGISSGSVVAGVIGASDRYDYTVLGDAVNVASRLCSSAGPDEIVIDGNTLEADEAGIRETLTVKGREAPIDVIRIR